MHVYLGLFAKIAKYSAQIYQRMTEIRAIATASFAILAISIAMTESVLLKNNLELLFVFISALSCWSFKLYQKNERTSMIFRGIDAI